MKTTPYLMYHHLVTFHLDIFMRRAKAWCDQYFMEYMMWMLGGGKIPTPTIPDFTDKRTGGFYEHLYSRPW